MLATYEHEVGPRSTPPTYSYRAAPRFDALGSWVARLVRYAVTKHGLADALRKAGTPGSDLILLRDLHRDRRGTRTSAPGEHRRRESFVRNVDAEDVILALAGLWQLDPAGDWSAQAQRIYEIVPRRSAATGLSKLARRGSSSLRPLGRLSSLQLAMAGGLAHLLPSLAAANARRLLGDHIRARARVLVVGLDEDPAAIAGASQSEAAVELVAA